MTDEQYQDILAACMRKADAEKEQEDREEAERVAGEGEGVLEDYQGIEGDS